MKLVSIDFEFREQSHIKEYDVLCVAMSDGAKVHSMWLKDNPTNVQKLKQFIENTDCTLIAHWCHAEIYSLLSLGINTDSINIIDTYVEAKLNQNSDDKSKRKVLSLADLCDKYSIFDYYGQYGHKEYKTDMRKLCIYNETFTDQEKADILRYCEHDAINGYKLLQVLIKEHEGIWNHEYSYKHAITRGNAVKGMTLGSFVGIPIDTEFLDKIKENHSSIIEMYIKNSHELVQQCYERKGIGYTFKADKYAEVIDNLKLGHLWKRSEKTNKYSTKADDLKELRHAHPFVESLYSTLRKMQSLKYLKYDVVKDYAKAFKAGELTLDNLTYPDIFSERMVLAKKAFLASFIDYPFVGVSQDKVLEYAVDYTKDDLLRDLQLVEAYKIAQKESQQLGEEDSDALDEDVSVYNSIKNGRIHIPYGVFGTITARNTPKAKLFLMAQSAWQRSLIKVPKGYKLVAADFSGEEIYVGAIFHNDHTMLEAYFSKDFYCYIGAMMGIIPQEDFGTMSKGELGKKYGKERKLLKGLILGLGYLMGVQKLGTSLFSDLPASKATFRAKKMADKYKALLHRYFASGRKFVNESKQPQWLHHWGHIGVERGTTANNFPIQGSSAEILHIAIAKLSTAANWSRGLKVVCPLHDCCVDNETEVLTSNGFKLFSEVEDGEELAQVDLENRVLTFTKPLRLVQHHRAEELYYYEQKHINMAVTKDHDNLVYRKGKGNIKLKADSIKRNDKVITSAEYVCVGNDITENMARLIVATAADGCVDPRYNFKVKFSFKKPRKARRLLRLLRTENVNYKIAYTTSKSRGKYIIIRADLPTWYKNFPESILHSSLEVRRAFIEELQYWDGCKHNATVQYSTSKKHEADLVQAVCAVSSVRCSLGVAKPRINTRTDLEGKTQAIYSAEAYICYIHDNVECGVRPDKFEKRHYDGLVYCATMPKGTLVIRRKGKVQVTGNCYALLKDDERFNDNLSLLTQGMKDATDEILGKEPHGRSIKIEYVIFEPESNLIEKDEETALQVAKLVGHPLNFKYSDAKEV